MRKATENTSDQIEKASGHDGLQTQNLDFISWFTNGRLTQNMHPLFSETTERRKKIQVVTLDTAINFSLIDPSIKHQDKWVLER